MNFTTYRIKNPKIILGWIVHILTASSAFFALMSLYAIYNQNLKIAFWLLGITVFIDSIDGYFARKVHIKEIIPNIDGALLDNIVDYLTYVIAPCFIIITYNILPLGWNAFVSGLIIFASSYQFTQIDAKTKDNFFKGFPCYWNFIVFYIFVVGGPKLFNLFILLLFITLVFIPTKYIYLSRLDYLTKNILFKRSILVSTYLFGIVNVLMLIIYPTTSYILIVYSAVYIILYFTISFYKTFNPTKKTIL